MKDREEGSVSAQLRALLKKGDVMRVQVLGGERTILDLPLNAGVAVSALGLAAAPWTLAAAALATVGLDGKIRLVKEDGSAVELLSRDLGRRAAEFGANLARGLKDRYWDD